MYSQNVALGRDATLKSVEQHDTQYISRYSQNVALGHDATLKSVDQHNTQYLERYPAIAIGCVAMPDYTGFACRKCGAASYYVHPNCVNMGTIPSRTAKCTSCGSVDYIYG